MLNSIYERIFKLLAKINMGFLDGVYNPERFADLLQNFLEKREEANAGCEALARAINILGQSKVITAEQSAKVMGMETPKDAPIRYYEETIRQCAEENKQGVADWRMIYCFGQSLRALREKFGTDNDKQPCFDKGYTWWLESKEDVWATKNPLAGYYLINVRGQFGGISWGNQEQEIVKIGKVERCHEATFAEAILTIFKVTGERIAKDWRHWGTSVSSDDIHVLVSFPSSGLRVYNDWVGRYSRSLRVSLARKFDF